jgi:hypothetical protein
MPHVRKLDFEKASCVAPSPTLPPFFPSLLFFPPILSLSPALALSPSPLHLTPPLQIRCPCCSGVLPSPAGDPTSNLLVLFLLLILSGCSQRFPFPIPFQFYCCIFLISLQLFGIINLWCILFRGSKF